MNILPRFNELVAPGEFTFNWDEELRLVSDRPLETRWFSAPVGTPAPAPDVEGDSFVSPWLAPWVGLNDPSTDAMDGVLIVDREDRSGRTGGLFVFARPTAEARWAWNAARATGTAIQLGAERIGDPGYRAIFPRAIAIPPVPDTEHVRFRVTPTLSPEPRPTWEVYVVAEVQERTA